MTRPLLIGGREYVGRHLDLDRLPLDRRDYYCPDAEFENWHVNSGGFQDEICYYCQKQLFYDRHGEVYYTARHIIEENPYT